MLTITTQRAVAALSLISCLAAGLGFTATARAQTPDYAAIIAAPDRTDADRQADARRNPLPFLAFTGAQPGMKVLDMGAGGGYSSELMARAVAPSGTVYAQNAEPRPERAKARFDARLASPGGKNLVGVLRPFDDPVPPDARDLDLVTFLFYYHDTTYMPINRTQMNTKLFAALKSGGMLVIADHSGRAGDGVAIGQTLHRIDEIALRKELEAAGFTYVATGDFWRHPDDTRDFSIEGNTGRPTDAFVMKFQKK